MRYEIGISGVIVVSGHNRYEPFVGSVGILGSRIAEVRAGKIKQAECKKWIDGSGKILMPGLVNGHCHGDMTLARGLGDDLTLLEQNKAFADTKWFHTLINDEDRFYSRQLTYCEALLSGTTFIVENMYWGLEKESVRAMKEVGIRGALAEDVRVDFTNPDEFISDEFIEKYQNACEEAGIIPLLGGVSEEDFETERLKKIQMIAREKGLRVTCHLAENTWREKIIEDKYHTTSIDYLYRNKLLDNAIIGSHVVYASQEEIKMLKESGSCVVNTPLCEMKIQDGIAPIPEMVKAGIPVCMGTDGAMWNNSNDIFREMKGMSLLHTINSGIRSLSKKDILDMATMNGAKCFGLEEDYGTIEVGKKADFILVETQNAHMQPIQLGVVENVTSALIYNATGKDVTDVFVDGKHVVSQGKLLTVDLDEIINKVKGALEKINIYLSNRNEKDK